MSKSVRFQKAGGPEVLQLEEVVVGAPGPGEARVLHKACGVNFLDIYQRSGLYKLSPCHPGRGMKVQVWWRPWVRASPT